MTPTTPRPRTRATARGRAQPTDTLDAHIARWTARALLELGLWRRVVKTGHVDPDLLEALGLEALVDQKLEPAGFRRILKERLTTVDRLSRHRTGVVFDNVQHLSTALHLSPAEADLLALIVAAEINPGLQDTLAQVRFHTLPELASALARILGHPVRAALHALHADHTLRHTGLLILPEPDRDRGAPLFPMSGLPLLLTTPHDSADALVARFFRPHHGATLRTADYPHLAPSISVLRALLREALALGTTGVNVLFHGPPGTGKSALAHALARDLNAPLFEVADQDHDGDPISGPSRLDRYQLCQRLLAARGGALLLFDEFDDMFIPSHRRSRHGKAWTNHLLETNPVPAIWITNDLSKVDRAYLRRFDHILEVRTPPQRLREHLLRTALSLDTAPDWLRRLAADDRLTPAHIQRAARAVSLIRPSPDTLHKTVTTLLDGTLAAQGRPRSAPAMHHDGPRYDLRHLNTSHDPHALLERLKARPTGALCLYGPPGTGKTAFAQHLADELGRPLLARRASDLLSCWLGGTEENFARLFQDATHEGAVLLLDEADSFLQDRSHARHTWEVTQVNELLVQMERFDGLFLCATNAFESLDPAALRRFSLELRFDPPRAEQRWALFLDTLRALDLSTHSTDTPTLRARLDRLTLLTPGDFRTVLRQARLTTDFATPHQVLEALEEEHRLKPDARRAVVGFDAYRPALAPSPRPVPRATSDTP